MNSPHLCLLAVATACLALPGLSLAGENDPGTNWTVRGHIKPEDFLIQSHRGAGTLAPENTMEAFELAWKLGTVPEADLRTTRDGVIVAFHDANFKRVVKGAAAELQSKGVSDVTFAELAKLDVGAWKGEQFVGRRVSRISDAFERMRGKPSRRLYLDIKNVDLKQLSKEVLDHDIGRQVILASTKYDLITEWKSLVPQSHTLLWMGGTHAALEKRLADLRLNAFEAVTQLQLHIFPNTNNPSAEPFTLPREFIRATGAELRRHGILFQTLPWEVTDEKVYHQLLDLGVASFATDHPEVTLKAVRNYYRK